MILFLFVAFLSTGCEHADLLQPAPPGPEGSTFQHIQTNILSKNCALSGCHFGGSSSLPGVMDLREGRAFSNLVGVRSIERPDLVRIAPGDPDNSYLMLKITGAAGIVGARMPLGRSPLSDANIQTIRAWIEAGAQIN